MSKFLYKVGCTAYRMKWPFLAVWLILLVAVGGLAGAFAKAPSTNFNIPGLEAVETQEKMQEYFPEAGDAIGEPSGSVVVKAEDGTLADPGNAQAVDALIEDLRGTGALEETGEQPLVSPVMAAAGMRQQMTQQLAAQGVPEDKIEKDIAAVSPLSGDKTTGTIQVTFDAETAMDIPEGDLDAVTGVLDEHDGQDGLEVSYNGNAFNGADEIGMTSELIGLAVAAVVLLVTFGSMVAAGMPLITAVVGVALGVLGVRLCTVFSDDINQMTPVLASMIGLAVGIDYALFITSRFRNELIAAAGAYDTDPKGVAELLRGLSREQRAHTMGVATGTAGTSVVFAGTTVLIALGALSIINIPFLTWMALAAAVTVAIAVLVAVTFLPALLGLLGTRAFAGRVPGPKVPDPEDEKPTMGLLWVRKVRAHPWLALGAGVIVLGLLAIPAANMRLAMPTDGSATLGSPQCTAYETTAEAFGDGRNAPMIALIEAPEDADAAEAAAGADPQQAAQMAAQKNMAVYGQAVEDFSAIDGVENAQIVGVSEAGDAAQVLITPDRRGHRRGDLADAGGPARPRNGLPRGDRRQLRRHRRHPDLRRHVRASGRRAPAVHRHRAGARLPGAHARLPLDLGAADRRARLRAVGGRDLRRDRGPLPGGLGRHRRGPAAAAELPADHAHRTGLRPGHGLRGLPGHPHARGLPPRQDRR